MKKDKPNEEKSAVFSACKKYRYVLTRTWDKTLPIALCIGLNPSKANGEKDDATIRILRNSLKVLGFGSLRMMNLYAFITPKPNELFLTYDAQGDNELHLDRISKGSKRNHFLLGSFQEYRISSV